MDLRALRYFVSVGQLGSVTRAAQALNIAQPALSRQIHKLEHELNVTLLLRKPRGMELTPEGTRLLRRAEAIFRSVQDVTEELRAGTLTENGRVSLGVPPATGALVVPALARAFRAELPQATLHIREGVGNWLTDWVLEEQVEVALIHNPPRLPELRVVPLITEHMVLVLPHKSVRTDWPVPRVQRLSLSQAAQLPLILPTHPHTNRLLLDGVLARQGQSLRPFMEVDSVGITKALVEAGLGATILTHAAAYPDVLAGRLRTISIERPPLISTLALVSLKQHHRTALQDRVEKLLRETLSLLARQGRLHGVLATSKVLVDAPAPPTSKVLGRLKKGAVKPSV